MRTRILLSRTLLVAAMATLSTAAFAGPSVSGASVHSRPSASASMKRSSAVKHHRLETNAGGQRIDRHLDRKGNRVDNRLDRRGDRINNRLDRRGENVNDALDTRAEKMQDRSPISTPSAFSSSRCSPVSSPSVPTGSERCC